MWIDPTDTNRQILGVDQGTLITLNGGKTWSSWFNQPTAQIYHVSTDSRFPYWVYGAQQDSGAVALPSRTEDVDGITMQDFHEVTAGGESGMIAPDPDDANIVYGGTVSKLDLRTGQTRNVDPTLAYPAIHYRGAWTLPLAFSKRGKKTLYFANQRLFRTADGGEHWAPVSPDLTRPDAGVPPNLDAPTASDDDHVSKRRGVIYTIAPSPLAADTLWVGTDDGLVWRTHDAGAHWQDVTPPALTPWSKVGGIEVSHVDPATAYLAIDRHRLDDDAPYIYRTANDGKSWTRIDAGIGSDAFVNVVREDPVSPGLLYAGTERGMFVSFNDGGHWQSLEQNLPMTSVRDIDVHGADLVIATHGRGFWIMDDVSALRQMGSLHDEVLLFKPEPAIRLRPAGFTGTPRPKDEPLAGNPPDGALIDYALPTTIAGPVTLTILDAQNRLVRSFSSADPNPPPDPSKLEFASEWLPPPATLSTAAGMHRFVWSLRYPTLTPASEPGLPKDGVWAPPGRYTVALDVGGRRYQEPLLIEPDPRVSVPTAALQREFMLARLIDQTGAQVAAALDQARKLLEALEPRLAQSGAAQMNIASFTARTVALSGLPTSRPPNAPEFKPLRTDSLQALAADLDKLEDAVDGADADPGPDTRAACATLSRMVTGTLAEWHHFLDQDLTTLNRDLGAAGEPPVAAP